MNGRVSALHVDLNRQFSGIVGNAL